MAKFMRQYANLPMDFAIARARGMTDIAKASGLTREALYKALRPDTSPGFDTIIKVCKALGVKVTAVPLSVV
jgi:probable addiction module antidote protein